jgi:broad specificity polyphosphatase/5'/3'-nucleotidase SurE
MSDSSPRSVSWITVVVVFAGFALFYGVVSEFYRPRAATMPYNVPAEQLPADQAWKATPESRNAYRAELQKDQAARAGKYVWIDQSKGSIQLPLDRAMELAVRDLNARAKR